MENENITLKYNKVSTKNIWTLLKFTIKNVQMCVHYITKNVTFILKKYNTNSF